MAGEGGERKKPPVDGLMLCVRVSGVVSREFSHKTCKDCNPELSALSAPWSSMLGTPAVVEGSCRGVSPVLWLNFGVSSLWGLLLGAS